MNFSGQMTKFFEGRSKVPEADHLLRLDIPDLQAQTAEDVQRMQRSGLGFRQFVDGVENFRQAIEGDAGVQVMDVMVADVGREPSHDGAGFHKAGGFKRSFFVSPAVPVKKRNAGKVVLRVK